MDDIKIMETWNTRLKECMEAEGFKTQMEFVREFNKRYKTKCTQTDVSRWLRVGESSKKYDKKTYEEKEINIGFPSYINMKRAADMLNVSVAYLTGETDYDSFNLEKVCKYTGIRQDAMKTICSMTRLDRTDSGVSYTGDGFLWYKDARNTISSVFESPKSPALVYALQELIQIYSGPDKTKTMWSELEKEYGMDLISEAIEHMDYMPEAGDPVPTEELITVIRKVEDIIDVGYDQQLEKEYDADVFRYRAQRAFNELLDNMFPQR